MELRRQKLPRTFQDLHPRHMQAIRLIAMGWDSAAVAKELGVTAPTVHQWRCRQWFKNALHEVKMEIHQEFMNRVTGLTGAAVDRLADLVSAEVSAPLTHADQLKAIKLIFDTTNEALRTESLVREIETLKGMLAGTNELVEGVEVAELPAILEAADNVEIDD